MNSWKLICLQEPKEVLRTAALVCRQWLHLVTAQPVWADRLPPQLLSPGQAVRLCDAGHARFTWPRVWANLNLDNLMRDTNFDSLYQGCIAPGECACVCASAACASLQVGLPYELQQQAMLACVGMSFCPHQMKAAVL